MTVGIVYFYRVSALDTSRNESAFSNQAFAVPRDTVAPATPQNLTVSAGDRLLDLKWSANTEPDVNHYIVYRSLTNGFAPSSSDSLTSVSAPDTTFRDTGIEVDSTFITEYRPSIPLLTRVDSAFRRQAFLSTRRRRPRRRILPLRTARAVYLLYGVRMRSRTFCSILFSGVRRRDSTRPRPIR